MSKTDKLIAKLRAGTISAREARTLLEKLGWTLRNQVGSHETWKTQGKTPLTLSTHTKELKPYQVRQLQQSLLEEKNGREEE
ncbi:MAG: type II toxin-antitoxin system HicA family toxin [Bdellovibrionales bacterium]|nr:type II toxin-antitoxin system HicA family toxin [Bdellovibrionales bacterium]